MENSTSGFAEKTSSGTGGKKKKTVPIVIAAVAVAVIAVLAVMLLRTEKNVVSLDNVPATLEYTMRRDKVLATAFTDEDGNQAASVEEADGVTTAVFEADNGERTEYQVEDEAVTEIRTYAANGALKTLTEFVTSGSRNKYSDAELKLAGDGIDASALETGFWKRVTNYSASGQKTDDAEYDRKEALLGETVYGSSGEITEKTVYSKDGSYTTYLLADDDDFETQYDSQGSKLTEIMYSYTDTEGELIKTTAKDGEDIHGNNVTTEYYDEDGDLTRRDEPYYENGVRIGTLRWSSYVSLTYGKLRQYVGAWSVPLYEPGVNLDQCLSFTANCMYLELDEREFGTFRVIYRAKGGAYKIAGEMEITGLYEIGSYPVTFDTPTAIEGVTIFSTNPTETPYSVYCYLSDVTYIVKD